MPRPSPRKTYTFFVILQCSHVPRLLHVANNFYHLIVKHIFRKLIIFYNFKGFWINFGWVLITILVAAARKMILLVYIDLATITYINEQEYSNLTSTFICINNQVSI